MYFIYGGPNITSSLTNNEIWDVVLLFIPNFRISKMYL